MDFFIQAKNFDKEDMITIDENAHILGRTRINEIINTSANLTQFLYAQFRDVSQHLILV